MSQLSEKDLALLSALMYSDAVVDPKYKGNKLSELVHDLLNKTDTELGQLELYGDFAFIKKDTAKEVAKTEGKAAGETAGIEAAGARFRKILGEIKNSSALMDLTI